MTKKYTLLYGGKYGTLVTTSTGAFEHIRFTSTKKDEPASYITDNEEIQKVLESARNFNVIYKVETLKDSKAPANPKASALIPEANPDEDDSNDSPKITVEEKEFPDVHTIQEAKDILKGEPYKISAQKLKTPDKILAAAAEVGAVFPNIK